VTLRSYRLLPNLAADRILLLIQGSLFCLGDVPAILAGHVAFFVTNLPIFPTQLCALSPGQFAFPDFLVNATVLVLQALVHTT
jgi:hypothetical protein